MSEAPRYGIIGVFGTQEGIRSAAEEFRALGLHRFESYTPYPVEELGEIVHPGPKPFLPLLMFVAALAGGAWGFFIQYWDEAIDYPLIVGGRPYNSWPAFVVGAFEFMLLVAMAAGLFGMLAASRLPQLYHPIFDAEEFGRASRDRFVLCVEASDPAYEPGVIRRVFERLGAERIEEVHP